MSKRDWSIAQPVRLTDCAPGDILIADDGFPCIPAWRRCLVRVQNGGEPFIWCRGGANNRPFTCEHSLDGQLGENGFLVGLRRLPHTTKGTP